MAIPLMAIMAGLNLLGSQVKKLDKATEVDTSKKPGETDGSGPSLAETGMNIYDIYKKVKESGKDISMKDVLSDEECKFVREFRASHEPGEIASIIIRHGEPLDASDLRSLVSMIPKEYLSGLPEVDFGGAFGSSPEEEEILKRYAGAVHNYFYNYKPQSGENPETLHTGSMAQEVERVDPALVKAGPRGKMVDAPRLTLTNTGAIGTLARKTEALELKVQSLEQQVSALLQQPQAV